MRSLTVLALAALVAACHSHDHADHAPGGHDDHGHDDHGHGHAGHGDEDELPGLSFTHWTDETELFVELPPLIVGRESPFAAHLTRLGDFAALGAGTVVAVLSGGGADERFEVAAPSVPGIFRPVAVPKQAGKRRLAVVLVTPAGADTHDLGEVTVYPDVEAAKRDLGAEEDGPATITFLKEQQWKLPFGTAWAGEHELRPSVAAWGTLRPRTDGHARVTAPAAGRLVAPDGGPLRLGARVEAGAVVAIIAPLLGGEPDTASLELAVSKARIARDHARRERQRLESLLAAGAVAERRVADATWRERDAGAELAAAERRLQAFREQRAGGANPATAGVEVRAPIGGVVTVASVLPETSVEAGQLLAEILDPERLWLEARVPEANVPALGTPHGAWFEVDGLDAPVALPPDSLVSSGTAIDPESRTLPLLLETTALDGRLHPGMAARVRVASGPPVRTLAVPATALVDDGGSLVAYVQPSGEAFERRMVQTGIRDRGLVQITAGLEAGERVVVRGAYAVKLAASASSVPAHGHAH